MKRIVFKLNQFPHLSETFILAQIITAIKCGFKVTVLISELLDVKASKQEDLIQKYGIAEAIIIEDFKIPKKKITRSLKFILLLFLNIGYLPKLIAFYKEQKVFSLVWLYQFHFYKQFKDFEIAHIQYGTNVRPFDILKKSGFFKSKLLVSFHGHDAFFPINGFLPNNGYYDALFGYGDSIIANTPYLAYEISELGCPSEKLKIIPVGVDTNFFTPPDFKKNESVVLQLITVGRLDRVKGHEYAIEVAEMLHEKGCQIQFTIVGEGREREALEQLIEAKNLQNVVQLAGRKGQDEVREMLHTSDLFLFTSVATYQGRRETQGLATLEAQACGLPAVVFDSGGVKYTIEEGKTGFIVPEYDVIAMSEKIEILLNDAELRTQMGKAAVKYVRSNFSQQIIFETWKQVYTNS